MITFHLIVIYAYTFTIIDIIHNTALNIVIHENMNMMHKETNFKIYVYQKILSFDT